MLVVADTSPVNYLILIEAIDLLPRLYQRVTLPRAALNELRHPRSPPVVLDWAHRPPEWIEIRSEPEMSSHDLSLDRLGMGEKATILLAQLHRAGVPLLLLDDLDARQEAKRRGFRITGTLGILIAGARNGWVNLSEQLFHLRQTSFRAPAKLLDSLLAEDSDVSR